MVLLRQNFPQNHNLKFAAELGVCQKSVSIEINITKPIRHHSRTLNLLFPMKTPLNPDEKIIKQGAANLQKNIETVGGKLYLTNQRLVFEAHSINIQGGTSEIALSNVQSLRPCWTKFLGLIPLLPNSLAVYNKQGEEYRFVLFGRHAWAAAIDAQRLQ